MDSIRKILFFCIAIWAVAFAQDDTVSLDTLDPDTFATTDTLSILDTLDIDSIRNAIIQVSEESIPEDEMVPDGFGLGTPRQTMYSLLQFQQEDNYYPEIAGLTFNQKEIKKGQGAKLATLLIEWLDGTGNYIDYEEISNDSNYVDTLGNSRYSPITDEPLIYMLKQGDNWLFSARTARELPKLHREVYPFGKVSNILPEWSHQKVGPLQLWQWMGIALFMIFTYLFYKLFTSLLSLILGKILTRWIPRDRAKEIYDKVSRPLSLFLMVWLLRLFIPILELPPQLNHYIVLVLKIVVPIFSVMIFYNLVDLIAAYFARKAATTETTMDDQLVPLMRKLVKAVVIIIGFLLVMDNFNFNISAMLAGLSIGGIAIALAAQDTVKNFFGSIMIFVDKPFQVGDWIISGNLEGVVEEVGVRSTRIRTFANSLIYVPNGILADGAIDNFGLRTYRRFKTSIGLMYDTPPDKMEAFVLGLREIVKNHPHSRKDYYEIHFTEMGAYSLNIMLYMFFEVPTWSDELHGKQTILLAVMRLAEALGVSFAFPTQTLHVENMPGKPSLTPEHPGSKQDFDATVNEFIVAWQAKMEAAKGRDEGNTKAWAGGEG